MKVFPMGRALIFAASAIFLSALYSIGEPRAQDLSGITIGSDRQALRLLGAEPVASQTMGPHSIVKYVLPGGNEFSATFVRSSGKIVFLETDWGGESGGSYADWSGMKFGQTTLTDIRKMLGSNGFAFKQRPGVAPERDGGIALFNSYQIRETDVIVTFVTIIPAAIVAELKRKYDGKAFEHLADNARLHSVLLASTEYADTIWGREKISDPRYLPVQWGRQRKIESNKPPAFSNYRVSGVYGGAIHLPDFEGREKDFRSFRTRLRDGMRQGADFAGEYHVVQFGCGTGCSSVLLGNVRSGEVVKFPQGGEDATYLSLKYEADSSLMIAQWANFEENTCYLQFLNFKSGAWTELNRRKVGDKESCTIEINENIRSMQ
jgi:hypothetical protein